MIVPHRPLDALRLDSGGGEPVRAAWLIYATLLDQLGDASLSDDADERARQLRGGHERLRAVALDHALRRQSAGALHEEQAAAAIIALTRDVAESAERAGALQTAYSLLAALDRIPHEENPLEYGRALALRARVARKADALDVADTLYRRVGALGRETKSLELRARAMLGRGIVAQSRGNLPAARRWFRGAARAAERHGHEDLARMAHHSLMVLAAKAGAFGEALAYGWRAFRDVSGNAQLEAEMLLNLGQLALDVGDARAALHGFMAAIAREPAMSQLLPALGGAARAAAALGSDRLLSACAARLERTNRSVVEFAYPRASAWLDLARAYEIAGAVPRADDCARRARDLGVHHGFHEISIEADGLLTRIAHFNSSHLEKDHVSSTSESTRVDRAGRLVLAHLAALETPEHVWNLA